LFIEYALFPAAVLSFISLSIPLIGYTFSPRYLKAETDSVFAVRIVILFSDDVLFLLAILNSYENFE
jgi:hypothetical protein